MTRPIRFNAFGMNCVGPQSPDFGRSNAEFAGQRQLEMVSG